MVPTRQTRLHQIWALSLFTSILCTADEIFTRPLHQFISVPLHMAGKMEEVGTNTKRDVQLCAPFESPDPGERTALAGRARSWSCWWRLYSCAHLFVLAGFELVYVSRAVVNRIALWGGGHSQMFSTQRKLQERLLHSLLLHLCQPNTLLCQPSPLGGEVVAFQMLCLVRGQRETRTANTPEAAWASPMKRKCSCARWAACYLGWQSCLAAGRTWVAWGTKPMVRGSGRTTSINHTSQVQGLNSCPKSASPGLNTGTSGPLCLALGGVQELQC